MYKHTNICYKNYATFPIILEVNSLNMKNNIELTTFGRKIKTILNQKGITQAQFGEMLGLAQSTINGRLTRSTVGFDKMLDMANALGYDLDVEFIPQKNKIQIHTNMTRFPVGIVAAGAGTSVNFYEDDAFEDIEFPNDIIPSNADCGIRINGDSMSPDYPDGCVVWVKQTTEIKYGDKVVAVLNGCPYFKIYEREGLRSINPDYPIIKIYDDDKISVYGKVIGVYTGNI